MPLARLQPWARPRDAVRQLLHGATVRTCAPVAVVVGTLLSAVNQGDVALAGDGRRSRPAQGDREPDHPVPDVQHRRAPGRACAGPCGPRRDPRAVNEPILADAWTGPPRDVDVLVVGAGQAGLGVAQRLRDHPHLRVLVVDALPVGRELARALGQPAAVHARAGSAPCPACASRAGPDPQPVAAGDGRDYLRATSTRFALPVAHRRAGPPAHPGPGRLLRRHQRWRGARPSRSCSPAGPFRLAVRPRRRPRAWTPRSCSCTRLRTGGPTTYPPGRVLVVGGGNSAAQLALELRRRTTSPWRARARPGSCPRTCSGSACTGGRCVTGVLNARADAWVSRYVRRRGDAVVGTRLRTLVRQGRVQVLPHRVVAGHEPPGRARRRDRAAGVDRAVVHGLPSRHRLDRRRRRPRRDRRDRCTSRARRPCRGCTGWGCRGRPA